MFDENGNYIFNNNLQWNSNNSSLANVNPDLLLNNNYNLKLSQAGMDTNPSNYGLAGKGNNQRPLGNWEKFGIGTNALLGFSGAINSRNRYKLDKRQLYFNESLANRNIKNSAITTNQQLENQAFMASQGRTGAEVGSLAQTEEFTRLFKSVDGEPIGV